MRMRNITLTLLLALIAGVIALPTYAQEPTFGLSEADIDLITRANAALAENTTFAFNVDVNVNVNAQGENIEANINANGHLNDVTSPTGSAMFAVNGSATNGDEVIPLEVEARIVEGNIYVNAVNPETGEPTGWQGTALEDAFGSFEEGFEQGSGGMDLESLSSDPEFGAIFDILSSLDPEAFVSAQRVGNADVNGVSAVHFSVDLSIADLLQTEQISQLLGQQMGGGAEIPAEQLQMITQMFASLFENAVIRLEQYISEAEPIVLRTVLTIDLNIDPSALGAGASSGGNIVLQLGVDATFSNFGETISVEVPEGAVMSDLSASNIPGLSGNDDIISGGNNSTTDTERASISAGESVVVNYVGDAINFNYVSNGNETITVTAKSVVAGGIDTTLEVSSGDFSVFAYNDDHGTSDASLGRFDSQVVVELPTANTYTIALGSFSFAQGEVEVTVTSEAAASNTSSTGGSSSTTTSAGYPVSSGGTIAYGDVVEEMVQDDTVYHFEFDGNSGDIVSIAVRRADSGFDPVVALYLDGVELTRNDDHGTGDSSLASFDSLINDFRLTEAGTYTIEVRGFAYFGGAFELTLSK